MHQWKVICLSLVTGEVQWERTLHEGVPTTPIHLKNSFASETPVTDGTRIYAYFGNVGLYCLSLDGDTLWSHPVAAHKLRYGWGTAASPILDDNKLFIVDDNEDESTLAAYDVTTGDTLWRVAREEGSNWATPYLWKHAGRTELVTVGSDAVRSYDLDGNVLWSLKGMSSITIATPYESDGLLFISSGYVGDSHRPLYAIRPGASGDISLAEGETTNEWIAWSEPQGGPYTPTTLAYQ